MTDLRELMREAERAREEEARKLAAELAEARNYELQVLQLEEKAIAEEERARLEREQAEFLKREAERAAILSQSFLMDEERRIRAEAALLEATNQKRLAEEASLHMAQSPTSSVRSPVSPKSPVQPATRRIADQNKVILIMTVDIGDGRVASIEVKEFSNHLHLAREFVSAYDLPKDVINPLAAKIKQNVEALLRTETPKKTKKRVAESPKSIKPNQKRLESMLHESPQQRRVKDAIISSSSNQNSSPTILKRSKMIAKDDGTSVFDRLYTQSKSKEVVTPKIDAEVTSSASPSLTLSKKSRELMANRSCDGFENYGVRLYQEGIKSIKTKESKLSEAKANEAPDPELTFRPKLPRVTTSIKREGLEPWERIIDPEGKARQVELETLQTKATEDLMKKCTFKPQINKRSEKLVLKLQKGRSLTTKDHATQLYLDASRRSQRMKEYSEWFPEEATFKPTTLPKKNSSNSESREDLINRLVNSKRATDANIEELRRQIHSNIDPLTGQPLFTPITGRSPKRRNSENMPIGDWLFMNKHQMDDIKQRLTELDSQVAQEKASVSHIAPNSARIVNELRARRLKEVFDALDTDKDGVINPQLIENYHYDLDDDVVSELLPLIKATNRDLLTFADFVCVMDEQLSSNKWGPRPYLYAPKKKTNTNSESNDSDSEEEMTFTPQINQKSVELASKKRPSTVPIEEVLLEEAKKKMNRLEQQQMEKIKDELSECTFTPSTLLKLPNSLASLSLKRVDDLEI
ncbi:hypothetical protein RCL1_005828 [Eukaryota sp. TZLM3-RCL]